MQTWKELYLELANSLSNIEAVKWIDLWHNQISFIEDEHPFPSPALFLGFSSQGIEDAGDKMQRVNLQVDVYLFYETFSDTYKGSVNQTSALNFLNLMDDVHKKLHGTSGNTYSEMRRIAFSTVDSGNAGNLYLMQFVCGMVDNTASPVYEELDADEINLQNEVTPGPTPNDNPNFDVETN